MSQVKTTRAGGFARIYKQEPTYFKWAAMAAIASHHVRLALLPFRIHTDRNGTSASRT